MYDGKINMSDYLWSSANKAADKRASEVLINKIHNEFSDAFSGFLDIGCFGCTLTLQVNNYS